MPCPNPKSPSLVSSQLTLRKLTSRHLLSSSEQLPMLCPWPRSSWQGHLRSSSFAFVNDSDDTITQWFIYFTTTCELFNPLVNYYTAAWCLFLSIKQSLDIHLFLLPLKIAIKIYCISMQCTNCSAAKYTCLHVVSPAHAHGSQAPASIQSLHSISKNP